MRDQTRRVRDLGHWQETGSSRIPLALALKGAVIVVRRRRRPVGVSLPFNGFAAESIVF